MPYLPLAFAHLLMGVHYGLVLSCLACFLIMFIKDLPERKHYKTAWFLMAYALHGLGIILTLLQYAGFVRGYSITEWLQAIDLPVTFYTQILLMIGMVLEVPIVIYIAYQDFNGLLRHNQRQAKRLSQLREENVKALVIGVESERRRLATDLHDGLSVNLAAIKLKANLMEIQAPTEQKTHWQEIMKDVETVYDELRHIVHNLPPQSLFRVGLQGALEEIIQRTKRLQPHLTIIYQYHLPLQRPKPEAEAHLYRIVLELLNNVLKHAAADELSIQLTAFAKEQVLITVEDNGCGFNVSALQEAGMGLANIRQRAHLLGGDLVVDSRPQKGTTMVVTLAYAKIF
jgi:signal transduction histidine kinase